MSRLNDAYDEVVRIFNDSAAIPGNEPAFLAALDSYGRTLIAETASSTQPTREPCQACGTSREPVFCYAHNWHTS